MHSNNPPAVETVIPDTVSILFQSRRECEKWWREPKPEFRGISPMEMYKQNRFRVIKLALSLRP